MSVSIAPYRYEPSDRATFYRLLVQELDAYLQDERDWLVNLSNASALIYQRLPELNWSGFYLLRGEGLVLGPFQGKPACTRIALGRGVCGTTAASRLTTVVPDVHAFPGHIACDSASESEVVVPMLLGDRLLGVLDLDSPRKGRFTGEDAAGLEAFAARLVSGIDWPSW
ncbi:MAG: GAF domain-containing protein [Opitutaceae bacterium]|nr:GAF domain-containing protein [Opitutaceae bacterium]